MFLPESRLLDMKKLALIFTILASPLLTHAGIIGDLAIDAEDSVTHFFYLRGLSVISIQNLQFVPQQQPNMIAMKSDISAQMTLGGEIHKYQCMTYFKKTTLNDYEVTKTECQL